MSVHDFLPSSTTAILTVLAGSIVYKISRIGQREALLPPGPPTIPVLGNITLLPKDDLHLKFTEWARQYGDVFSLKIASGTIIVISSPEAVAQIMEKNGLITSNRRVLPHFIKIFGESGNIVNLQYGPKYRTWRKAANDMMSLAACERHAPVQLGEASQLMVSLLDHPENFIDEIKRTVLSTVFSVFFGVRSSSISSPVNQEFLRLTQDVFDLSAAGAYPPVDLIPLLYYLPDRFANNWKRRSDDISRGYTELWSGLLKRTERKMEAGILTGCFIETLIPRASEWGLDVDTIKDMAGSYTMAATHTTISTMTWFVMLAAIYPGEQRKLREEMDRVVGPDRLPTREDMPKLPYLHAFIRELHRFRTIAPIGVPHVSTEDQLYNGYLIPKDAMIFVNLWEILHDPAIFDHPDVFDPERFMNATEEQTQAWKRLDTLPFGVGRRMCPGMHLANTAIELIVACLIWGFEFESPEVGGPDVDNYKVVLTTDPLPFKCNFKPQSPMKEEMIRQNFASYRPFFDKFEKDA